MNGCGHDAPPFDSDDRCTVCAELDELEEEIAWALDAETPDEHMAARRAERVEALKRHVAHLVALRESLPSRQDAPGSGAQGTVGFAAAPLPAPQIDAPMGAKARTGDPATSQRAARDAFPRAGNQRHRILAAIFSAPDGLTYDEAAAATRIVGVSVSTRITELARGGWIAQHGERQTAAGGSATVWVATEQARAMFEQVAA